MIRAIPPIFLILEGCLRCPSVEALAQQQVLHSAPSNPSPLQEAFTNSAGAGAKSTVSVSVLEMVWLATELRVPGPIHGLRHEISLDDVSGAWYELRQALDVSSLKRLDLQYTYNIR